jgi:hypothetical protein
MFIAKGYTLMLSTLLYQHPLLEIMKLKLLLVFIFFFFFVIT